MEMNHENIEKVDDYLMLHDDFVLTTEDLVVQGGCNGADRIAEHVCNSKGIPVCGFKAPWNYYGHSAGPIRNGWMLDFIKPDLVIAFHPDLSKSRGTANMIEQAEKAGVKVEIVS